MALIQGHHQIVMASHEELQHAEKDLNHILMIKAYLGGIEAIRETLEVADCTSQLCKQVLQKCGAGNTAPVIALLENAIEQDAVYSKAPIDIKNNRLWAVKVCSLSSRCPGLGSSRVSTGQAEPNSVLERARQLYRERTNEMHEYIEDLNEAFQGQCSSPYTFLIVGSHHPQKAWELYQNFGSPTITITTCDFTGQTSSEKSQDARKPRETEKPRAFNTGNNI